MALSHIAYLCGQRSKETYSLSKEAYQKRPIQRDLSKETHSSVKRDLFQCQKRPIPVSKETYSLSRPIIAIAYLCFGGQRSTARNEQTHLQIRLG